MEEESAIENEGKEEDRSSSRKSFRVENPTLLVVCALLLWALADLVQGVVNYFYVFSNDGQYAPEGMNTASRFFQSFANIAAAAIPLAVVCVVLYLWEFEDYSQKVRNIILKTTAAISLVYFVGALALLATGLTEELLTTRQTSYYIVKLIAAAGAFLGCFIWTTHQEISDESIEAAISES